MTTSQRIEYEADPRHREVLSLQLGLADGKTRSVTSPFEKIKITPDTEQGERSNCLPQCCNAVGFSGLGSSRHSIRGERKRHGETNCETPTHAEEMCQVPSTSENLDMVLCSTTISAVYPGEVGYRLGKMPTYLTKHKRHISTFRTAHLVLQQHNASACLSVFR